MLWITATGIVLCCSILAYRWIKRKQHIRRRQRPLSFDLSHAPARIRHNLRRPATPCT